MKILHVLNHSVPHTDGYCIRSANIVRFQREIGLDPIVVTSPHQEPVPTEPREVIEGIPYYRILTRSAIETPVFHELQAMRRLRDRIHEIAREEKPAVIHAHSPCTWGLAAHRAARRCGLPFVYEVRGLWEDSAVDQGRLRHGSLKYRAIRWLETAVARQADAVVTIAKLLVEEFEQRGINGQKLFLVQNGVNMADFSHAPPDECLRQKLGLNGCLTIGYVGSLSAWEGVDDLVRAVPAIVSVAPKTKLLIVGKGETEQELRSLIASLSLEQHVALVGSVPHREIAKYYALLDILVYPRRRSRTTDLVTPLKPLEAMALGKPILASDVGGLRELLTDGAATFFLAGDPKNLAARCLELIQSPQSRASLGESARRNILGQRDWQTVLRPYIEVYGYALRAHGKPKSVSEGMLPHIKRHSEGY